MIYDYCKCGHPGQHKHYAGGRCHGCDAVGDICGCQQFKLVVEDHHRERVRNGLPPTARMFVTPEQISAMQDGQAS